MLIIIQFIFYTPKKKEYKNETKKEMSTTPGIPRRSPIQVLTGLDAA